MKSSFLFRGALCGRGRRLPHRDARSPAGPADTGRGQRAARASAAASPPPRPRATACTCPWMQAIRVALANNQDLNVSVNAAEASQFFLFQNTGIYDPLLTNTVNRRHTDSPQSSALGGADVLQNDSWDAAIGLSQLTPWGGVVDFGLSGSYNTTNSTFVDVNPAIPANLFFGINQPLLRNFGKRSDRAQHHDLAQHARRLVSGVRAERPDRHQLGRAVVLGPRVRPRQPGGEARGPGHRDRAQPHHEDQDRRRIAGADRHRPDRGRHRHRGAGHHHGRGRRRPRGRPPPARPQLPGREPHDGPRDPDRRSGRPAAVSPSISPRACGPRSRAGPRSSPRTTRWTRTRCATSTGRTRRCRSSTSWRDTERTGWAGPNSTPERSDRFEDQLVGRRGPALQRELQGLAGRDRVLLPDLQSHGARRAGSRAVQPRDVQGEPDRARAGHRPRRARRAPRRSRRPRGRSTPGRRPRSSPSATSMRPARSTTTA